MKTENKNLSTVRIPQPGFKIPFLGHLFYMRPDLSETFLSLSKLGPIYRLQLGSYKILVVTSLELVKEVCDESRFEKNVEGAFSKVFAQSLPDVITTLSTRDPFWERLHRTILPGFAPKTVLEDYYTITIGCLEELFTKWKNIPEKEEVNINNTVSCLFRDIFGLLAFDYRFNSLSSNENQPVAIAMEDVFKTYAQVIFLPNFLQKLFFRVNRKLQHDLTVLDQFAEEIIERKNQTPEQNSKNNFLNLMLNTTDKVTGEKLSKSHIKTHIIAFYIAAQDSTTALINFAFYALMTYPNVLEKAYAEIDQILGTNPDPPPAENFLKLQYMQQVLNECLRLWFGNLAQERTPLEDTILGGKYPVKKGENIWTVTSLIQRDKTIWGEDANSFNPDRFAPELQNKRDPCTFLPFGVGKRTCLGRQVALFEASVIIGRILQKYRLHLRPDYKFGVTFNLSLFPNTLWATLEKRIVQK